MQKQFPVLLAALLLAGIAAAQKTSYDLAGFTPPAGWSKSENEGVLMYSPPQAGNSYCLLTIYKSTASAGSLPADFAAAWKELVADRLQVKAKPSTEKGETENGWESQTGYASFTLQGNECVALLATMSGYNKAMNVLVITNDQAYDKEVNAFFESISMKKPPASPAGATAATMGAPGTLGDYIFTVPPGWKKEINANEIVLRATDGSVLSLLPFQPSSGNLEKDMNKMFWETFPGWMADPYNSDNNVITKGISPGGWPYYKDLRGIRKEENGKVYQAYGFIMLALVNNQAAVIVGSYGGSNNKLAESTNVDWLLFFHSLDFKNYKGSGKSSLATSILGTWLTGSYSGLITYTFAANGRYDNGAAHSTSHDISEYRVLEKTTSFAGNGKYSLKGNELTLTADATKKATVCKVRVFDEYSFGAWHKRIGMLEKSVVDGSLYEVTMAFQEK